jgi:ElaB/YqjD/DUF883 family membrane-anchored ribosome-binding protein
MGYGTHWEFAARDYLHCMDTHEMKEKAQQEWQETAENLKDKTREWQRVAAERARHTGHVIDEYVNDNAWMSVVIAAALGCAIGLLLSRSRD